MLQFYHGRKQSHRNVARKEILKLFKRSCLGKSAPVVAESPLGILLINPSIVERHFEKLPLKRRFKQRPDLSLLPRLPSMATGF